MHDIDHRPISIPKATIDILLKQKEPLGIIGLYTFYYYTAIWQKTNQPKATTNYAAKGLKVSTTRIRRYKAMLLELNLVEEIIKRSKDNKHIAHHFIKVKYYETYPTRCVKGTKSKRVRKRKANTYSNSNSNSYSNNKRNTILSAKDRKSLCSTDKSSFDKKMSIQLEDLLREKRKFNSRTKPNSWPAQFLEFRRKNEITKKRFSLIMKFYCKHFGDKYIPKAYFANMFCDKFIQIEEARERLLKEISEGKPRTVKRKKVGSKTIYGNEPQQIDGLDDF